MFTVSFPVFYYGAISYVDPGVIAFLMAGLYVILIKRYTWFYLVLIIGAFAKETIVLLIPVFLISLYLDKFKLKIILFHLLSIFLALITIKIFQQEFLQPSSITYLWLPEKELIIENINRPRAYVSNILSFGIPGILMIFFLLKHGVEKKSPVILIFLTGIFFTIILSVYAFLTAYADGRFVWTSNVFTIPFIIYYCNNYYYQEK
jgi:hypothetical protein